MDTKMSKTTGLIVTALILLLSNPSFANQAQPQQISSNKNEKLAKDDQLMSIHVVAMDTYCIFKNKTYDAGETFKPDPCTVCYCPKDDDRVDCSIQDCRHEPDCLKYSYKDGECCGTCVERGCRYNNGTVFKPGQVVMSDNCEMCYCPYAGGRLECDQVNCPPLACVDPVKKEGECCEVCPNGPNCWIDGEKIPAGKLHHVDSCNVCQCPTQPLPFWLKGQKIQAVCKNQCAEQNYRTARRPRRNF